MSFFEFFIFPEAVLTTGIIIFFLLHISNEKLKNNKVEVQIGRYDKDYFAKLSPSGRKKVRYIVLYGTIVITILTCLISLVFIKVVSCTVVSFLLCLALQIATLFLIGIPLYRKIQNVDD